MYQLITEKVEEGEVILNELVESDKLSDCGRAAFIAATDPFHDKPISDLRGWPDLETAPSVIRLVKQSLTLTNPAGAGGCIVIYTYPVLDTSMNNKATRRNCIIDTVTNVPGQTTGVAPCIVTAYTAAKVNANNLHPNNYDYLNTMGMTDDAWLSSPTRLIGMGVEVHDVTAELYKQGTCTVFSVPQSQDQDHTLNFRAMAAPVSLGQAPRAGHENTTSSLSLATSPKQKRKEVGLINYIQTVQDARIFSPWPEGIGAALLYEGSRQWEAKDGAYVVIPFTSKDNVARAPEYMMPVIRASGDAYDKCGDLNISDLFTGPYASGSEEGDNFVFLPHSFCPTHSKGIFLSGLSEQSTFQINVNMFLETFPQSTDDPLVTLARPSASFDPVALEMISRVSKSLPVGVPVAENGMGDFFLETVESIAPLVGGIASAFFPEFSPLIMPLAEGASALAAASKDKRAFKRAAKGKPPKKKPLVVQTKKVVKTTQPQPPNSFGRKNRGQGWQGGGFTQVTTTKRPAVATKRGKR